MNPIQIQNLTTQLINDFDREIHSEKVRTSLNNATSALLLFVAIVSSALAGILGIAEVLPARQVGIIAFLPTLLVLLERSFKFDRRGRWHIRKRLRLEDLKDQLIFQQPPEKKEEQIAQINKKKHQLNAIMQEEWDSGLALDWAIVDSHPAKKTI